MKNFLRVFGEILQFKIYIFMLVLGFYLPMNVVASARDSAGGKDSLPAQAADPAKNSPSLGSANGRPRVHLRELSSMEHMRRTLGAGSILFAINHAGDTDEEKTNFERKTGGKAPLPVSGRASVDAHPIHVRSVSASKVVADPKQLSGRLQSTAGGAASTAPAAASAGSAGNSIAPTPRADNALAIAIASPTGHAAGISSTSAQISGRSPLSSTIATVTATTTVAWTHDPETPVANDDDNATGGGCCCRCKPRIRQQAQVYNN